MNNWDVINKLVDQLNQGTNKVLNSITDFNNIDYKILFRAYEEVVEQFEQDFNEVRCLVNGHNFDPDQCGKPDHDYCLTCGKLAPELGYKRVEKWRWEKINET